MTLPKLDNAQKWTLAYRLLLIAGVGTLLYLRTLFATHPEVREAVQELRMATQEQIQPLAGLPLRVHTLELFTADQKVFALKVDGQTAAIREDLAAIKAGQTEMAKSQDRIFRILDQMRADAVKK
jgi:hypothetical protein